MAIIAMPRHAQIARLISNCLLLSILPSFCVHHISQARLVLSRRYPSKRRRKRRERLGNTPKCVPEKSSQLLTSLQLLAVFAKTSSRDLSTSSARKDLPNLSPGEASMLGRWIERTLRDNAQ